MRSLTRVVRPATATTTCTARVGPSLVRPLLSSSSTRFGVRSITTGNASTWYPEQPPRLNLGLCIVPEQKAYIVERLGKWSRTLNPGLHWLIPVLDRVSYVHSLKEQAVEIQRQKGITSDNVEVNMDGVLYFRVIDPKLASYGVEKVGWAISQMAQTTMRAEIGKITLDKTFAERESLNHKITESINKAGEAWGIQCLRYEIKDINTPEAVRMAMDRQAQAERTKRATVLDSEGHRDSEINVAEGQKQSAVLAAVGTAEATIKQAEATARAINLVAEAISKEGGREAVSLRIAEQYIRAFGNLAQKSTTMLLPANTGDAAAMVAQAMSIYDKVAAKPASQLAKAATSGSESFKLADAVAREGGSTR